MNGTTISSVSFKTLYSEVACTCTNSSNPASVHFGRFYRNFTQTGSPCALWDVQATKEATFRTPFPLRPYTPDFWPPYPGPGLCWLLTGVQAAVHLALC